LRALAETTGVKKISRKNQARLNEISPPGHTNQEPLEATRRTLSYRRSMGAAARLRTKEIVMSIAPARANPRAPVRSLPEVDPFKAGERWLQDIRLTREYLEASGRGQFAHRPEAFSSFALHAAARRQRTKVLGRLGRRFAAWLRRCLNEIVMG
jgi:hypothetical protein